MVAAEVQVEPAHDDGHGRVGAHGHEEEGGVLQVRPGVHRQQDGEAGDGHADGDDGEEEAVPRFVGRVGDQHREGEGGRPRRHAVQLRADGGVAVGFDDGGGEEGVACAGSC